MSLSNDSIRNTGNNQDDHDEHPNLIHKIADKLNIHSSHKTDDPSDTNEGKSIKTVKSVRFASASSPESNQIENPNYDTISLETNHDQGEEAKPSMVHRIADKLGFHSERSKKPFHDNGSYHDHRDSESADYTDNAKGELDNSHSVEDSSKLTEQANVMGASSTIAQSQNQDDSQDSHAPGSYCASSQPLANDEEGVDEDNVLPHDEVRLLPPAVEERYAGARELAYDDSDTQAASPPQTDPSAVYSTNLLDYSAGTVLIDVNKTEAHPTIPTDHEDPLVVLEV